MIVDYRRVVKHVILLGVVGSSPLHDPCLFGGVLECLLDIYLTVAGGQVSTDIVALS